MTLFVIERSKLITERLLLLINKRAGIDATYTASSFEDAVELMNEVTPDIVLLDMNLGGLKSIDLVKIVKTRYQHCSFIVLFNQVNDIKKQYCEYLGVDYIFDKYYDIENINPAIDTLTKQTKFNTHEQPKTDEGYYTGIA